jgi:hypothetical protein
VDARFRLLTLAVNNIACCRVIGALEIEVSRWFAGVVAIDIVRVPPSRLNTLASQAAQTLISPASQVSRSQNRKTGVQLKRIIWGLPRSAQNPNPATPGGERYGLFRHLIPQSTSPHMSAL